MRLMPCWKGIWGIVEGIGPEAVGVLAVADEEGNFG